MPTISALWEAEAGELPEPGRRRWKEGRKEGREGGREGKKEVNS